MAASGQTGVSSGLTVELQHDRPKPGRLHVRVACLLLVCVLLTGCGTVETAHVTQLTKPASSRRVVPRRYISAAEWRAAVQPWLGTPYRYGGNDRRGIDCSGFTRQLYKTVAGIDLPRTAQAQFNVGVSVPRSNLRAGDLVFFSEAGRGIVHVGISLGGDEFAHASVRRGVTITSLREPWYAARWCGAKRVLW